jgi:hypothetical protein
MYLLNTIKQRETIIIACIIEGSIFSESHMFIDKKIKKQVFTAVKLMTGNKLNHKIKVVSKDVRD